MPTISEQQTPERCLQQPAKPAPILYSLQHCPYAMRARMGILLAKQPVILRAIVLKSKPEEMLKLSSKGTVPVLVIDQSTVIDESLDIMLWALSQTDPDNLLYKENTKALAEMLSLINRFDNEFKQYLENYKCAKRYHESSIIDDRKQCETFIVELEQRLTQHKFIIGETLSLADYAILPFIRQFARVERQWYLQSPYPNLQQWLKTHLQSRVFSKAMTKFPLWLDSGESFLIGSD